MKLLIPICVLCSWFNYSYAWTDATPELSPKAIQIIHFLINTHEQLDLKQINENQLNFTVDIAATLDLDAHHKLEKIRRGDKKEEYETLKSSVNIGETLADKKHENLWQFLGEVATNDAALMGDYAKIVEESKQINKETLRFHVKAREITNIALKRIQGLEVDDTNTVDQIVTDAFLYYSYVLKTYANAALQQQLEHK